MSDDADVSVSNISLKCKLCTINYCLLYTLFIYQCKNGIITRQHLLFRRNIHTNYVSTISSTNDQTLLCTFPLLTSFSSSSSCSSSSSYSSSSSSYSSSSLNSMSFLAGGSVWWRVVLDSLNDVVDWEKRSGVKWQMIVLSREGRLSDSAHWVYCIHLMQRVCSLLGSTKKFMWEGMKDWHRQRINK